MGVIYQVVLDDILSGRHVMFKKSGVFMLAALTLGIGAAPVVFAQGLNNPDGQAVRFPIGYFNIFGNNATARIIRDSKPWFSPDGQCLVAGNDCTLSNYFDLWSEKGLICSMPAFVGDSGNYNIKERTDSGFVVGLEYSFISLPFHDFDRAMSFFIRGYNKTTSGNVPSVSIYIDIP